MESFSHHSEVNSDDHVHAEAHASVDQQLGKDAFRTVREEMEPYSRTIAAYLMERVKEFKELSDLRQKGWNSRDGDRFFENRRRRADRSDTRTAQYFYEMMQKIAKQLHQSTKVFTVSGSGATPVRILDLCMAPGGFLKTALEFIPDSSALAFSLPTSSGGHGVLLEPISNVAVHLLDITMLAADMGVKNIPSDHPDAENFGASIVIHNAIKSCRASMSGLTP